MASIYKKPPLALLEKPYDKKNLPKETYKMQNKDPCSNKTKVEIHINSGRLGVKFTANKTIPDFNKGAKNIHLDWTNSFEEFENVLEGQYKTAWKQVMHDHFPEPGDAAMVPSKAGSLAGGELPSCNQAFSEESSPQREALGLPVQLLGAGWRLQRQEGAIRDSRLCRLHSDACSLTGHVPLDDGTHLIIMKPTAFYSRVDT
jgi:hypothetical protein